MAHFKEVCDTHGVVLRQCRCPSQYKMVISKTCPGKYCPGSAAWVTSDTVSDPDPAVGGFSASGQVTITEHSADGPPSVTVVSDQQVTPSEQPMPKIGGEGLCAQDLAIAGIQERKAIGLERYGTLLYPFNSRDMFRDLIEECQDAIVYAHGYMAEREIMAGRLRNVIVEIVDLRVRLITDKQLGSFTEDLKLITDKLRPILNWVTGDTNAE